MKQWWLARWMSGTAGALAAAAPILKPESKGPEGKVTGEMARKRTAQEQKEERVAKREARRAKMLAKQHGGKAPAFSSAPPSPLGRFPSSYDPERQKMAEKLLENPLVPLGFVATTISLGYMARAMYLGDSYGMFVGARYRVAFQFSTFMAILAGAIYKDWKAKRGKGKKRKTEVAFPVY